MSNSNIIIGREYEQRILRQIEENPGAQLVAVYGRRRVGKTYLIKTFFKDRLSFCFTGTYQGSARSQLGDFATELSAVTRKPVQPPDNWREAFALLRAYLSSLKTERRIVFIDEMPWLETPKSEFLAAFSFFWNNWAETQDGLKVIICGSAASWMVNKIIGSKGGLYGRLSRTLYLRPFSLGETEQYLRSQGIVWNRRLILQTYMIFGGIPYYLRLLNKDVPFTENIDSLFFRDYSELRKEYHFLFQSLFSEAELYRRVVDVLAEKKKGLSLEEIRKATGAAMSGRLSEILDNLERCEFLRVYYPFRKKKKGALYQLIDPLCIFYHTFIKTQSEYDPYCWTKTNPSARSVWAGYAFERICLLHIPQIRQKLQLNSMLVTVCSWAVKKHTDSDGTTWPGAQIDLILDRADGIVDLCEIKFTQNEFVITAEYADALRRRADEFVALTGTKSTPRLVFITSEGVRDNSYSGIIQANVTADDLFAILPD